MKLLLDTNVLIDYFARREPFFDDMVKLVVAQAMGDVELWICPHSFPDASYILRKVVPNEKLQEMFEESLKFLNVSSGAQAETSNALKERWSDFEDSFVVQCALRVGADYIITRDASGFEKSRVPVLSPSEFVENRRLEGVSYDIVDLLQGSE